mmetsp:Transcript_6872/g.13527  ORF Transcript_6872/g.13527 Transcript_6872/m.13527 type:complete len:86 (+) Transcript_6872:240-497(+)
MCDMNLKAKADVKEIVINSTFTLRIGTTLASIADIGGAPQVLDRVRIIGPIDPRVPGFVGTVLNPILSIVPLESDETMMSIAPLI